MKKDIIVETLRFGKEATTNHPKGLLKDEIKSHLKKLGFELNDGELLEFDLVFDSGFKQYMPTEGRYILGVDSYFTLLEYDELEEARKSSKAANRWAITALAISIITVIISIVFSVIQLKTPTEIKQSQINTIVYSNQISNINLLESLKQNNITPIPIPIPIALYEYAKQNNVGETDHNRYLPK